MRRLVLAALAAIAPAAAHPEGVPPAVGAPAEYAVSWTAIPGRAAALAVGRDGAVFALDGNGHVWLRRPGAGVPWISLPGSFLRIAAADEKQAWAVDNRGTLHAYNGTWWRPMGDRYPIEVADVGVSANGATFAVTASGVLIALTGGGVQGVADAPGPLVRVTVDEGDHPWVIDRNGAVHHFDGRRWVARGGPPARDLGPGSDGTWIVGTDGELSFLASGGARSPHVAEGVAAVGCAPGGSPWIATGDGQVYAANPDAGSPGSRRPRAAEPVFTRLLGWRRISGRARQLAISPAGDVVALGTGGEVWQWKERNEWRPLPGRFARIAIDAAGRPLGVDHDGRVLRFQGSHWTEIPGDAIDVAGGADGSLWSLQVDGTPAIWVDRQRTWQALAPGKSARRIAIAPDGLPWIVDAAGAVFRFDGKDWVTLPVIAAAELAVGPEGSVFVADTDRRLWRWDSAGRRWEPLNGEAAVVAVGPRGRPWIAAADAGIYAAAFSDDDSASQPAPTRAIGAGASRSPPAADVAPGSRPDEPLAFQRLPGAAREIAIGAEGSVFVLAYDSTLALWSNGRNGFVPVPGQFARIAATRAGKVWGVTRRGEVYRQEVGQWHPVHNIVAIDVATAYDGTVMVVGPDDALYRYDSANDRFDRIGPPGEDVPPPAGIRVALEPGGTPWVIRRDGFVARCPKMTCERLPAQALDIDIGPEGSVFIVDIDRTLRRWNARWGAFERIASGIDAPDRVAVGPFGKPWLITQGGDVWSSAFFPRDESGDPGATTSPGPASIGDTPVFTFTGTLSFDVVPWSGGLMTPMGFAVGASGKAFVLDQTFKVLAYDPGGKRFVTTGIPFPIADGASGLAAGPDDSLWAWKDPVVNMSDGVIRRYKDGTWKSIAGLSGMGRTGPWPGPFPGPIDIAVTPDGTVFGIGPDAKLHRYDPTAARFVPHAVQFAGNEAALAVEPNGTLWVVSASNRAYQYVSGGFLERRAPGPGGLVCNFVRPGCIRAGAGGALFTIDASTSRPLRWNAAGKQWDKVVAIPASTPAPAQVEVGPDGRLWMLGLDNRIYRAR